MSMLSDIVASYFCTGILTMMLLSCGLDDSLKLLDHGKTVNGHSTNRISKKHFSNFYLLGFTLNTFVLLIRPSHLLLIFQFHLLRRIVESFFVFIYSASSHMHIIHYLAGLSFYPMVSIAFMCAAPKKITIFNFAVFLGISLLQFQTHSILYNIRSSSIDYQPLPKIHLFRWLLCPHYFLEILIYLWIQTQHSSLYPFVVVFAFVCTNILLSSIQTKRWYSVKFGPDSRNVILPWF